MEKNVVVKEEPVDSLDDGQNIENGLKVKEEPVEEDGETWEVVEPDLVLGLDPVVKKEQDEEEEVILNDHDEGDEVARTKVKGMFQCGRCDFLSQSGEVIQDHVRRVHEEINLSRIRCGFNGCNFKAGSLDLLHEHLEKRHYKKKQATKIKCGRCAFVTESSELLQIHLKKVHASSLFKCGGCIFIAESSERLQNHVRKVHMTRTALDAEAEMAKVNKSGKFAVKQCKMCDFSTPDYKVMEVHKVMKHSDDGPIEKKANFRCGKCKFHAKTRFALTRHSKLKHKHDPQEAPEGSPRKTSKKSPKTLPTTSSTSSRSREPSMDDDTVLKCTHCDFETIDSTAFKLHNKKEHDLRCGSCRFRATERSILQSHIFTAHLRNAMEEDLIKRVKKDLEKCRMCGFVAVDTDKLEQHYARHHPEFEDVDPNRKVYRCNACPFVASRQGDLAGHMRKSHLKTKEITKK